MSSVMRPSPILTGRIQRLVRLNATREREAVVDYRGTLFI